MINGWINLEKAMMPPPGRYVDLTDGENVDVGFYEGGETWYVCIGCVDVMNIIAWKPRPKPPSSKPEINKDECDFIPQSPLGRLEAIVLYFKDKDKHPYGFHVTDLQYAKLNGGEGRIYGRTPWGPFCELQVYDYKIIASNIIRDQKKLEEIATELSW